LTFVTFTEDDKIETEDGIFEFGECPEWEARQGTELKPDDETPMQKLSEELRLGMYHGKPDIDELAGDISLVLLAEWIAIEHDKTRLQGLEYMEEAQELADWLYTIGYRLVNPKPDVCPECNEGIIGYTTGRDGQPVEMPCPTCQGTGLKPDEGLREKIAWEVYPEYDNWESGLKFADRVLSQVEAHYQDRVEEAEKRGIDTALTAYESACESLIEEAKKETLREVESYFDRDTTRCTVVRMQSVEECYVIPVKDWKALKEVKK